MKQKCLILLCLVFVMIAVVSCANIGSPDGGPYDEEPPRVLTSTPLNGSVNTFSKKISIQFDEYVKLENASEKVVITPPQNEAPNVRTDGKKVKVDLYDDLMPNTTYTIDFGDAIVDNNEGNPMGFYTFTFSTGATIDTMAVSGMVLNAENLEPIKGILVGLYNADSVFTDSTFRTRPLERIGRTNGSGQFSIRGVANGRYRVFALQDGDQNYMFTQKSEVIGFDHDNIIQTTCAPAFRRDTVWIDSTRYSKIRMVPYIHYYPDDVVVLAFAEENTEQHLRKMERPVPEQLTAYFFAPNDTVPTIEGINFDASCMVVEASEKKDTITYWLRDTTYAYQDTLKFYFRYHETDTTGLLVPRVDTMEYASKLPHEKIVKERNKQIEEWQKDYEKRARKSKEPLPPEENPYLVTYMDAQMKPGGTLDPNQNLTIIFSEPLDSALYNPEGVRLTMKVDTVFEDVPYKLLPVPGNMRAYRLYAEWEQKGIYKFETDSNTFVGILGHPARPIKQDIRIRSDEEYGSLFLQLQNVDSGAVVQLLNKSDNVVRQMAVDDKNRAEFFFVKPSTYYMRLFVDRNGNGKWDTGEYAEQRQPEQVYYFPKPIAVRAKFDVEQEWDVKGIPLTEQKPKEIIKQKADKQKNIKDRNKKREEERKNRK